MPPAQARPCRQGVRKLASHKAHHLQSCSQTSLACLILITPLGVACYYSILLGGKQNNVMVPLHFSIRNSLRTHSIRVRRRKCLSQPRQPGPRQRKGQAWSGGHRVEGRYGWVLPPERAPRAGACQAARKGWARPRRTGMGVRVRLGEGLKLRSAETSWSHPTPCTDGGIEAQVRTETYFRLQSLPDAQLGPASRLGLELHSQCPELPWISQGTQPGLGEKQESEPLGSQQLLRPEGTGIKLPAPGASLGCPRSENF